MSNQNTRLPDLVAYPLDLALHIAGEQGFSLILKPLGDEGDSGKGQEWRVVRQRMSSEDGLVEVTIAREAEPRKKKEAP